MGSLNGGGHVVTIKLPMVYSLKTGGYIGNVVFLTNADDWAIRDAEGATIDHCSFIGKSSVGMVRTASVSYTHLDVYKRQGYAVHGGQY